jgi:hypothetical protein
MVREKKENEKEIFYLMVTKDGDHFRLTSHLVVATSIQQRIVN